MEKLIESTEMSLPDDDFWLNVDYPTGLVKLHKSKCRHCVPGKGLFKKINKMGKNGGWFSFSSASKAKKYFEENEKGMIWQPCKVCQPTMDVAK